MHPCLFLLSVLAGFGGAAITIWTRSSFFLDNRIKNAKAKSKRKVTTFRPLHSPIHTAIKPNQILSDQVAIFSTQKERRREHETLKLIVLLIIQRNILKLINQANKQRWLAQAAEKESSISERKAQVCLGHCGALQLWTWPTISHTCLKSKRWSPFTSVTIFLLLLLLFSSPLLPPPRKGALPQRSLQKLCDIWVVSVCLWILDSLLQQQSAMDRRIQAPLVSLPSHLCPLFFLCIHTILRSPEFFQSSEMFDVVRMLLDKSTIHLLVHQHDSKLFQNFRSERTKQVMVSTCIEV